MQYYYLDCCSDDGGGDAMIVVVGCRHGPWSLVMSWVYFVLDRMVGAADGGAAGVVRMVP